MKGSGTADEAVVVAYHDVVIAELRSVLGRFDIDLREALERERLNADQLDDLEARSAAARALLEAAGATIGPAVPTAEPSAGLPAAPMTTALVPPVAAFDDFDSLVALASWRLESLGVDLSRDPLVQVLPPDEMSAAFREYATTYGEVEWSRADLAVVIAAATVGTLLDVLLVGTPKEADIFGRRYPGSPITRWLKTGDLPKMIQQVYLHPLERRARWPLDARFEADAGYQVSGLSPWTHRLQNLDHDPVLAFVLAVLDLLVGKATFVDDEGHLKRIDAGDGHMGLVDAVMLTLAHLLSDVGTGAGLPAPLLGLLQLVQGTSPFTTEPGSPPKSWTEVTAWMYRNRYDLRHFMASGVVPGAVTAIITGYWLLDRYAAGEEDAPEGREGTPTSAKLASMLALGHALTVAGTLVKTGIMFKIKSTSLANPTAFNWAELLAFGPVLLAWVVEASRREANVRRGLARAWDQLAVDAAALAVAPRTREAP